jgi:hypothetical protein
MYAIFYAQSEYSNLETKINKIMYLEVFDYNSYISRISIVICKTTALKASPKGSRTFPAAHD